MPDTSTFALAMPTGMSTGNTACDEPSTGAGPMSGRLEYTAPPVIVTDSAADLPEFPMPFAEGFAVEAKTVPPEIDIAPQEE